MAYMSYCRCEGTLHEFRHIVNAVQDHFAYDGEPYGMSEQEAYYLKNLIIEMIDFLNDNDLTKEYVELNREALEEFISKVQEGE